MSKPISIERLKEVVSYDPITGLFLLAKPRGNRPAGTVFGYLEKRDGYIRFEIDRKKISAHRAAIAYITGEWPDDNKDIDHKNRVRHDNRYANLAVVTRMENTQNNGATGISFDPLRNKWQAQICISNKRTHLGRYVNKEDALSAYREAKVKYHYVPN